MKKTKLLTSLAAFVLVLGLGACEKTSEEETSSEEDVTTSETTGSTDVTLPVLGEVEEGSYFLGFNMDNVDYYFDGTVYNTNYAGVTSEIGLAVPVTVAALDSGYSLSFDDDGNTAYLNLTESGTYRNLKWGSEVYTWSYDTTYSVFVSLDSEGEYYFIGTYGTYKDLTLNAYGYLTGDIETSNAQYPAKLYAIPDDWEATTPREDAGVSYEDIDDLSLLGYYDFSKSDYNKSDAFGSVDSETGEAKGLTQEQVVSLFSDCYVSGTVETSLVVSVESTHAYKAANGNSGGLTTSDACLKLNNSSSTDGAITLGVEVEGYTLSSVAITAAGYNNTETKLTVNGTDQTLAQAANALSYIDEVDSYTYDLTDASEIAIAATSRVLIFGIAIYGEEAPAEPQTETLDIGDMDSITSGDDEEFKGATWTYLTSCNISFAANAKARWSSNYIRAYADDEITFTPKDGHTLVGLSFTWYSGTTVKAITVVNEAASVTCDDNGAEITDIVNGSDALTIKVSGSSNDQLYIGGITISYL